jgi:predicted DsbA family dithiol-disulfide isomerase
MKPVIHVDVVSDVVCPWCYIGKRRLDKAMSSLKDKFDFEVVYHPFELNPAMPPEGKDHKKYLSEKFGGIERYDQLTGHVTAVASSEGIEFNYDKQPTSPNTRNAHRVIRYAEEHGNQQAVVENLFKAYFTDGVDLTKNKNLVDIASEAGLDKKKVEEILNSDDNLAEIIHAEKEMQNLGITGVPFYIINKKYGVSGAQASKSFEDAFTQIGNESVLKGESCDVDNPEC